MPIPDPHADELTVELDRGLWMEYKNAVQAMTGWTNVANELKAKVLAQLGDAYAGTIDGVKVAAYRPKDSWATTRLQQDYPDLVQHFIKYKTEEVFDVEAFGQAHPEILKQYQVRALNRLGQG